jgi:hypothetical protein
MATARTAEDRLRDYFGSAASVAGIKSVHGALIAQGVGSHKRKRANGGAYFLSANNGGAQRPPSSPEDKWWDSRPREWTEGDREPDLDGPSRARTVRQHAETHRALLALPGVLTADRTREKLPPITCSPRDVLTAVYGSPPWPGPAPDTRDADVELGEKYHLRTQQWTRQMPPEVRKALAELGFAALLAPDLAAAFEADPRAGTLPRTLVALCKADGEPLKPIYSWARAAHRGSLGVFCALLGLEMPERAERTRVRERRAYVWRREAARTVSVLP